MAVPKLGLVLVVVAVVLLGVYAWDGRDHFLGRRRMRQHRWPEALRHLRAFEARVDASASVLPGWMYLSLYTSSRRALVRNNIGVVHLNLGQLTEADAALGEAVRLDPGYAVAYVNLALLAAMRGDEAGATRSLEEAHRLGYRHRGAQELIRRVLARTADAMAGAPDGEDAE